MSGALVAVAAIIVALLGGAHLTLLYASPKLSPDDDLGKRLSVSVVPLSDATNLLRLWVGFNASHALGALVFGLTYSYLALVHDEMVSESPYLIVVGAAYLLAMLLASVRYWFSVPSTGLALATLLYLVGAVLGAA
ncbi:hypothetical protein [Kribbella sp. NPDC050470]|uniref:LIC_13387 family protein n=1 Tax=unclassified Kribbella TaxID=2644121 RepID=UPI0037B9EA45